MEKIIGVDAAKLAGLQIDMLQKMRDGHITPDHVKWFNNLTKEERDAFAIGDKPTPKPVISVEPTEKFALLADLGDITVPDGYVHKTCLSMFYKNNRKKFYGYNDSITDANFPHPSRILKPGDKLHIRAFQQIVSGSTTSKERMDFLKKQEGNVFTGVQGASLVFEQKRGQLPKGKWYASFDEAENLWEDSGGHRRLSDLDAYSDGGFGFDLGYLEGAWYGGNAFLSFSDFIPK